MVIHFAISNIFHKWDIHRLRNVEKTQRRYHSVDQWVLSVVTNAAQNENKMNKSGVSLQKIELTFVVSVRNHDMTLKFDSQIKESFL